MQNDKDLARGSPVGNVTQEEALGSDVTWLPNGAALQGLGKSRERALELVQATLYLQAAERGAGREAEVSTGSTAPRSQIRESAATTQSCYSCTICDGLFSQVSVSSSCHATRLLLLQEFLPAALSAFHTWLTNTCA